MNAPRFGAVAAAFCRTIVVAGLAVGWVAGLALIGHGNGNKDATAVAERDLPSGDPTETDTVTPQPVASPTFTVASAGAKAMTESIIAADKPATAEQASHGDAATTSALPQADAQPVHVASANPTDPLPATAAKPVDGSIEITDECLVVDPCIDRYLWALYQRTPKEDSIRVPEQRKVTVKRKGKTVTVTRTFTRVVDEDFGWKDPKAADKVGMTMMDYVIGGMDRVFKLKLFHELKAADEAGLAPGITSAFRDDYRQSIATGLHAADNRSYHGGSLRGGYGHGLAADIVSVKGATRAERLQSSDALWKWVDQHEKDFGIGRPYIDRDPPHVAPIDGQEYADHRHPPKTQEVASADQKKTKDAADHKKSKVASADLKKRAKEAKRERRDKVKEAAKDERGTTKRSKTAKL